MPKTEKVLGKGGVRDKRKETAQSIARGRDRFEISRYMSLGRTSVARSKKCFLAFYQLQVLSAYASYS